MNKPSELVKKDVEYILPWMVLAVLLIYSYARFFAHPYGFSWDTNGIVVDVFVKQNIHSIKIGDQLIQVGQLTWSSFHEDLRKTFFEGISPGTIIPVTVNRTGQFITLSWRLPGVNSGELLDQLFSEWFLAYIFWLVGTFTLLFVRPKDERWWLLSVFNYITAVWLISGGGTSNYHIWGSAIVLRMAIWLSLPIYLHLHWVFPRPLGKLSPLQLGVLYTAALCLMVAQFYQLLPTSLYFIGFLVAILGSLILLIVHAFLQPETRLDLRLILVAVILALVPLIAISVIDSMLGESRSSSLALLSFPLLPLAYLYAAYHRQLGGLEIRINRLISIYFFLITVSAVGIPMFVLLEKLIPSPNDLLIIEAVSIAITCLASIWGFPLFQDFVERRWLGISLSTKHLSEYFSARLATSNSFKSLEKLLKDEILSSLLIKQFAFVEMGRSPKTVFFVGIEQNQIPDEQSLKQIISQKAIYYSHFTADPSDPYSWIRLVLPLTVGDDLIGLWLFGRRDPDDFYSQSEIPLLESLANQTAIASSNILQSERLKAVYQADINRHEKERLILARDLHDSILNRLAALMMNLDEASLTPEFQKAYETLTNGLRETVSSLRPPLLDYGLKSALNELADNLMELSQDNIIIRVDLDPDNGRYDALIELYVFRIIQEACGNSIRHGQAQKILISGSLDSQQINLVVHDDGIGFMASQGLGLNNLIANEHFGLAGMVERAELIGAVLKITSEPKAGTVVQLILNLNGSKVP